MSITEEVLSLLEDLPEQMQELDRLRENVRNGLVATIRLIEQQIEEALAGTVLETCPDIAHARSTHAFRALRVYGKHYEALPNAGKELVILPTGKISWAITSFDQDIKTQLVTDDEISLPMAEHIMRRYASALYATANHWDQTVTKLEALDDLNDRMQRALGFRV